jgi:hypothetical protein
LDVGRFDSSLSTSLKYTTMAYNVNYLTADGEIIDETQVDENDEQLIWDLFKEFGHTISDGVYYEVEEVEEDE